MSAEDLEVLDAEDLNGESSTMQVHRRVRAAILEGELAPGSRLSQVRIAKELGVSRSPLREALRLLQNEGLVTAEHNRRMRVAPLTAEDLEELYAMRLMAEPLGVRITVPLLDDRDIAEIRRANAETKAALLGQEVDRLHDPHRRFHLLLASRAGSRLRRHIENLWDFAERYRLLTVLGGPQAQVLRELAVAEHDAMAVAAASRDGERCADLVVQHLARVGLTTIAIVDPEHDPATLRIVLGREMTARPSADAAA